MWLGVAYIRFVHATTRWTVEGRAEIEARMSPGAPNHLPSAIGVLWHGRLFFSPTYASDNGRRMMAMISRAGDGEVIARIVGHWGIEAVRGSTYDRRKKQEKGGAEAFAGAERALREGAFLAITPDGPRGPRMRAQIGSAELSMRTQVPIIPITFSVSHGIMLRSWDRFLLPLPFGRGIEIWSEPLFPPSGETTTVRAHSQVIEARLTELTNLADDRIGRARVLAAPSEQAGEPGAETAPDATGPARVPPA
ncbi:MAG: lysophospholipid acyltransferase family protein [Pseudomonadota bacterium]